VLTDFGIAKQVSGNANLTQMGMVFGTPSYLSPEQAQSQPLTPASDVYSLGVMLYELLAGNVPFRGVTPMQVVIDHIQTSPPPLPPRPDMSVEVEALVQRALAKEPADRFASAGELAQALSRAWGVSATPNRLLPNAGVHEQVTQHWQPPKSAAPAASALSRPSPLPSSNAVLVGTPDRRLPQLAPPRVGPSFVLPVLGTLLVILLLGGVLVAARDGARAADTTGRGATSVPAVIADATAAALATSAPTQAPDASDNTSSPATDPFGELRAVLEAARSDGRMGQQGEELLAALDSAQQALAAGDKAGAVRHLTAMQQQLLAGAHEGTIDASVTVDAMKRVQSLARSQGLTLPLVINFN
jgi:serine/threonine-protein kinase